MKERFVELERLVRNRLWPQRVHILAGISIKNREPHLVWAHEPAQVAKPNIEWLKVAPTGVITLYPVVK